MTKPNSYLQTDPRWKDIPYAAPGESSTIGSAGCGPTSAAMIIATLKDSSVTPKEAAAWSKAKGYKYLKQGTAYAFFAAYGKEYGLKWTQLNGTSLRDITAAAAKPYHDKALQAVRGGNAVIACMGPGNWTSSGHYILWYGFDEKTGDVLINDPNSVLSARTRNTLALFQSQVKYYFICETPEEMKGDNEVIEKIKVRLLENGAYKIVEIDRIFKGEPDNRNFFEARKLAEMLGRKVYMDTDGKTPVCKRLIRRHIENASIKF